MPTSFRFAAGRSRVLAGVLICVHLAAAALALAAAPRWEWRLAIALGVCASLAQTLRAQGWGSRPGMARVELERDGRVRVTDRRGREYHARLTRSTLVTPWIVILVLAAGGMSPARTLLVPRDSLPSDDFRRLRVWLRWGRTEPTLPLN
jgi:hypothetical protein